MLEYILETYFKKISIALIVTSALILGACNGDDSTAEGGGTSNLPSSIVVGVTGNLSSSIALSAENSIVAVKHDTSSIITLKNKIHSDRYSKYNVVAKVSPVSNSKKCNNIKVNDDQSGYVAMFDEDFVGVCVYRYDAANTKDADAEANAYSIVAIQDVVDKVVLFPTLSTTTLIGQSVMIDLKSELGDDVLDENYLLSEVVDVIGLGSVKVDSTLQQITYTPEGEEPGYVRLIYSYSDGSKVKVGNISVSISSSANGAPVAPDIDYSEMQVQINQLVTIDLTAYVSDPDGDALQLVDVSSWDAAVVSTAPTDINNLKFDFETSVVGAHYVIYVLSDHFGGYASGTVRVEVFNPEASGKWNNLHMSGDVNLYYGPLTKSDADAQEINYTSTYMDDNGSNVATFNVSQAEKLCETMGRLPTSEELLKLADIGSVGPSEYDGWPVSIGYYSMDGTQAVVVDLSVGGGITESNNAGGQYVTCVGEGEFIIDKGLSDDTVIANGSDKLKIVTRVTFDGAPLVGNAVNLSVNGSAQIDDVTVETDNDGYAIFNITDTTSEEVYVSASINGLERNLTVNFTGDPMSAEITLTPVVENSDISGEDVVLVKLVDGIGNALRDRPVTLEVAPDWDFKLINMPVTDSNGEISVAVKYIGQNPSGSLEAMVTAKYVKPNNETIVAQQVVNFTYAELVKLTNIVNGSLMGGTNIVEALVTRADGTPVANAAVEFSIDPAEGKVVLQGDDKLVPDELGQKVTTLTDSDGKARLEMRMVDNDSYTDLSYQFKVISKLGDMTITHNVEFLSGIIVKGKYDSYIQIRHEYSVDDQCEILGLQNAWAKFSTEHVLNDVTSEQSWIKPLDSVNVTLDAPAITYGRISPDAEPVVNAMLRGHSDLRGGYSTIPVRSPIADDNEAFANTHTICLAPND